MDLIKEGDFILSGGIANDTSFEERLNSLIPCNFVGVDPTSTSLSHTTGLDKKLKSNYEFFNKSLAATDGSFLTCDGIKSESVSISSLLLQYDFSLVKLDIEGSEYEVIEAITDFRNIKQVAVEFHHWVPSYKKTLQQTLSAIEKIKRGGFSFVFHKVNERHRKIQECLFIKKELTSLIDIDENTLID